MKFMFCLHILFSVSFHLRLGEIPTFLNLFQCAINRRVAVSLFWFYSVTSKFSFLASSTYYKPFDSESFMLCEHFPYIIRESVADWWFSLFHKTCHLAFPHMTYRIFSCHYWHPFGVHITLAISSHVVAIRYYLFTIIKLPSNEE